jgi:ferredoxin
MFVRCINISMQRIAVHNSFGLIVAEVNKSSLFKRFQSTISNAESQQLITLNWILKDGSIRQTKDPVGTNIMRAAHRHEIELEGACEGVCACSTCHVILENDVYENLPEPSETEDDMLDQAFGLTTTSRLGCQVVLTADLNGMTIKLPKATRNLAVDGHFNKPH